jgi:DNA topoisomerase-1
LQATGIDAAGRRQYLYHEEFREAQERAKYEKLIRFGERLPELREAMAAHLEHGRLDPDRVSAVAVRLVNLAWFRVGSDRAARHSRTFGVTTLRKRHVSVRGQRLTFCFRGKGRAQIRRTLVDEELADEVRYLLGVNGGSRVFRYRLNGDLRNLTADRLNDYIGVHLGDDFTAKDFRTWGGTCWPRSSWPSAGPRRRKARRSESSRPSCAPSASSSETRRPYAAPPTSARRSSSSISKGARSRISGLGICASSERAISGSTQRKHRCCPCLDRGEYARRDLRRS